MRILISRLSALGDTVCTLPVATALKSHFPESHITWAVSPAFAGIVECCPDVDAVERVKPGFSPSSWPRLGAFDLALDMQGLLKSAIVVARASSPQKLGYHWQREGSWLFSSAVMPDPSSHHIVDQYVDVARAAGAVTDRAEFRLEPKFEDLERMRTLLREHNLMPGVVLINAGAGWATKRWPAAHYASLIDALAQRGYSTALIGGKAQADQDAAAETIAACEHPPANLLGKTSVRELVALLSLAGAHVGGDTGSTHLSAALGRPAIGLYSITRPARSCPYGQIGRCHYDSASLANIEPEAVLATVQQALR